MYGLGPLTLPDKGRFLTFPEGKTRKRGKIGREGRLFTALFK
jgi:hypothetical protein